MNRQWIIQILHQDGEEWLVVGEPWFILKYREVVEKMKPRFLHQCIERLDRNSPSVRERFHYRLLNVKTQETIPGELLQ